MIDANNLCFGQKVDESLGILYPWYVHGALEEMKKWSLHDKIVWEWGSGASSIWWAKKAHAVLSAEHDLVWYGKMLTMRAEHHLNNLALCYTATHEGDQTDKRDEYVKGFSSQRPDIVVVDGIHRFECIEYALTLPRPLTLIVDNYQQDYVFMCPKAEELLKDFKQQLFIQADHTDHSGNPWQTGIFYIQ